MVSCTFSSASVIVHPPWVPSLIIFPIYYFLPGHIRVEESRSCRRIVFPPHSSADCTPTVRRNARPNSMSSPHTYKVTSFKPSSAFIRSPMDVAHCYLDGNADAVEFCPHIGFESVLAASTYTLHESADKPARLGSISIFDADAEAHRLELVHRVETAGIFDIRWNPVGSGNPSLAQADADGYLRIHHLLESDVGKEFPGKFLKERDSVQVSSSMCLYLDWHPSATSISVGLSDGSVSIVSVSESQVNVQQTWKAHDFELWTTCYDIHQPQLVYTGSDDCKFRCWDLRECPPSPAFQNSKVHTMGVTCIVKSPYDPHVLLTGSYDEHLRVWDVRSVSRPVNEASIGLGGGVWRIKYHPSESNLVLAACMHNGFAIVEMDEKNLQVKETYSKHGSLAYGADWQRGTSDHGGKRKISAVSTCSFYDRMLRLWIPQNDNL